MFGDKPFELFRILRLATRTENVDEDGQGLMLH